MNIESLILSEQPYIIYGIIHLFRAMLCTRVFWGFVLNNLSVLVSIVRRIQVCILGSWKSEHLTYIIFYCIQELTREFWRSENSFPGTLAPPTSKFFTRNHSLSLLLWFLSIAMNTKFSQSHRLSLPASEHYFCSHHSEFSGRNASLPLSSAVCALFLHLVRFLFYYPGFGLVTWILSTSVQIISTPAESTWFYIILSPSWWLCFHLSWGYHVFFLIFYYSLLICKLACSWILCNSYSNNKIDDNNNKHHLLSTRHQMFLYTLSILKAFHWK